MVEPYERNASREASICEDAGLGTGGGGDIGRKTTPLTTPSQFAEALESVESAK